MSNASTSMTSPITTATVLQFLSNWETIQRGQIQQGGKLVIDYEAERLSEAQTQFSGALFGELEVYVKFHPGGQIYTGSVAEKVRSDRPGGHGVVVSLRGAIYEVMVPTDAVEVEIWFRGFYQTTKYYEAWDNPYGPNYWFPISS